MRCLPNWLRSHQHPRRDERLGPVMSKRTLEYQSRTRVGHWLLFDLLASLSLATFVILVVTFANAGNREFRIWSWDQPQKAVAGRTISPNADPRFRTIIRDLAPGMRSVRIGVQVINGAARPYFLDSCYVGVTRAWLLPLASVAAILPAIWLAERLHRRSSRQRLFGSTNLNP